MGIVDALTGGSSSQTSGSQGYSKEMGDQYNAQISGMAAPYVGGGSDALAKLLANLKGGFNPDTFTMDPGYQFALEQGQRGVAQNAGTMGSPLGGNAQTELMKYATGLANQTYNSAFTRWNTVNQGLAGVAGLGENAATGTGSNLAQILSAVTGNVTSAANTQTQANSRMTPNIGINL